MKIGDKVTWTLGPMDGGGNRLWGLLTHGPFYVVDFDDRGAQLIGEGALELIAKWVDCPGEHRRVAPHLGPACEPVGETWERRVRP